MYRLTRLYIAEHWRRDLLMLITTVIIAAAIYLFYCGGRSYIDLGYVRHRVVQWWIFSSIIYAATAFTGYTSPRRAYAGLLLPASSGQKFGFEALRTLIAFPLISALLLLCVDIVVSFSGIISERTLLYSDSLWHCMTYTSLPLYHLPVMPYYLIALVALVLLIRSTSGWRQLITIAAVGIVTYLIIKWGPGDGEYPVQTIYPFLTDTVTVSGRYHWIVWCQPVSRTGLPMKAVEIISCIWLILIPAAACYIARLNIKEASLSR